MLKYKKIIFPEILDGAEPLETMLAGMSGKNRKLVALMGEQTDLLYLRVYRDGEQMIDVKSDFLAAGAPILPCDIPLAEGQMLKVGYYNNTTGTVTTQEIVIGYEESD